MAHFNFRNDATYHAYCWFTANPKKLDECLKGAWEAIPSNDWYALAVDTSLIFRDELTQCLDSWMQDVFLEFAGMLSEEFDVGAVGNGGSDFLFNPLLAAAIGQIYFGAIAEAILRDRGKWAPDKVRPEAK